MIDNIVYAIAILCIARVTLQLVTRENKDD
jgi:hypothetical protein